MDNLSDIIRSALDREGVIEIDGLGRFERDGAGHIVFRQSGARVFIAYAKEDSVAALRLYKALEARGHSPWLDRRKLLPGQNWPRRIEEAIATADFFIACFSTRSVGKRGGFQAEIRFALDCARRLPLDDVFLIPVRLDECRIPMRIERETQFVDLFPDWPIGFERVMEIIDRRRLLAA